MNNAVSYDASPATVGTLAFAAGLMLANGLPQVEWPTNDNPLYIADHMASTYSPVMQSLSFAADEAGFSFAQKIAKIYATLAEGQEPLGEEFEAIWDANVNSLYEA